MGWTALFVYSGASALAARCAWIASKAHPQDRIDARFWTLACAALTFLAINKQMDFQLLATEFARTLAFEHGWYGFRRVMQHYFLIGIVTTGVVLSAILMIWSMQREIAFGIFIIGFVTILIFVGLRSASVFHGVELGPRLFIEKFSPILELVGGLICGIGAARYAGRGRRGRPKSECNRGCRSGK